jgi:hypothetical protein
MDAGDICCVRITFSGLRLRVSDEIYIEHGNGTSGSVNTGTILTSLATVAAEGSRVLRLVICNIISGRHIDGLVYIINEPMNPSP